MSSPTDIVERLRRDLMVMSYDDIEAMVCEAADDIERLRAVLRAVADYKPGGDHQAVFAAVRRALEPKP